MLTNLITLEVTGPDTRNVYRAGRYVGNVERGDWPRHGKGWKAIPLHQVAHAYPSGIGIATTDHAAADLLAGE